MKLTKSFSKVASDMKADLIFGNEILFRFCARCSFRHRFAHRGHPPGEPFPRGERTRALSFVVVPSTSHVWLGRDLVTYVESLSDCPNFQNLPYVSVSQARAKTVTGDSIRGRFDLLRVTRNGRAVSQMTALTPLASSQDELFMAWEKCRNGLSLLKVAVRGSHSRTALY